MASTGQALTHFPQPLQSASSTTGKEVGGVHRVQDAKLAGGDHRLAAASAAVADEVDALAHVLAKLHQVLFVGLLEQIHPLARHPPGGRSRAGSATGPCR